MARLSFIILFVLIVISCESSSDMTVGIRIKGVAEDEVFVLQLSDSTYNVMPDSTGYAMITLAENVRGGYGFLAGGGMRVPLYIEPRKSFDLFLSVGEREATAEFSGEGAKKNEYLNNRIFTNFLPDFSAEEQVFVDSLEKRLQKYITYLDTLGFEDSFTKLEKSRLNYAVFSQLSSYPVRHGQCAEMDSFALSPEYYRQIRSRIEEDESLLGMEEYENAIAGFVRVYSTKDLQDADEFQVLKACLDYVNRNINNTAVAGFLVDRYATGYVEKAGIDHLSEISPAYNAKVNNPALKAKFDTLCGTWEKIAEGRPVPSFRFPDIDGKEVGPEDLTGKYVFIDIWAAWCVPCGKELTALKELEKQFEGKNITFVSISCDPDKAAWEQMVRDNALGGIQLYMGENREFLSTFMIRSIPRFILIDKEGEIILSDMMRPSDPQIIETLSNLQGMEVVEEPDEKTTGE